MKSAMILAVLVVAIPQRAFAFGSWFKHHGGLPLECQSRFHPAKCDHMWPWSEHHHNESGDDSSHLIIKACKVIKANVPAAQEIVIRLHVNADSLTASNDNFSETYDHNEKLDSEDEAVYEAADDRAAKAPAKISITELTEERDGSNKITIEWGSGNKEWLDCPAME